MTISQPYGFIGLGRMGASLVRKILAAGEQAVVYDLDGQAVQGMVAEGATGATTPAEFVRTLLAPRVIWIMVPAGAPVDALLSDLKPMLDPGDIIVDGGNSFYRDSIRRAGELKNQGVYLLDCGSSGGIEGALRGLCLMVGGERDAFLRAEPLFRALSQPQGCQYVGASGAGHFVKMVHNAIEYGMLEAIGEGFELLREGPYDIDLAGVSHLWNQGSVIRSWLLDLAARALSADPNLANVSGDVGGGATGSWAVEEAWRLGVPVPGIALAVSLRLRSRQRDTFTGKVVASLRREFGGHPVVLNHHDP